MDRSLSATIGGTGIRRRDIIKLPVFAAAIRPAAAASLEDLLQKPLTVRKRVRNQPGLYFSPQETAALRERAAGPGSGEWNRITRNLRVFKMGEPVGPGHPDLDKGGTQYEAGYALAELALAHLIEPQERYVTAARLWSRAIISWDPWGYTFRTPNTDLPPVFLMYGLTLAYDVFRQEFPREERAAMKAKIMRQARFLFDAFQYKPKRRYTFSQNHTFIPMTGLALAALTLLEEEPEAASWAKLARALYERTRETFGTDGYYYEGFHYSVFSLHWVIRFLDAWRNVTGEDLYPQWRPGLLPLKHFYAHMVMPGGRWTVDFGDTGTGAPERTNPKRGALKTGHEVLYRIAAIYRDAEAQGVADHLAVDLKTTTNQAIWSWIARDPSLKPAPIQSLPAFHHFEDHGTVVWRSGWDRQATLVAFRCAPPEGYEAVKLAARMPDWRLNHGHAHPDAGAFIVHAQGAYLTGTAGYTGIKKSAEQNTILVDGRGQAGEGSHEWTKNLSQEKLARLKLTIARMDAQGFEWSGEMTAAYPESAGMKSATRILRYRDGQLEIEDHLEAESPRSFTYVQNADEPLEDLQNGRYRIRSGSAALVLERTEPATVKAETAPLMVIARGRPGSVEKGIEEQRGYQLQETTAPARQARFVHRLRAEAGTGSQNGKQ